MNLELLYDDPVVGENKYGSYYLYAVRAGEEEYSFFAPAPVHEELQNFKRGEHVIVTKLAANRNGKLVTTYAIGKQSNGKLPKNGKTVEPEKKEADGQAKPPVNEDHYYDVMLKSYGDAISINEKLNGMIDVSKVAVTLFIARTKVPFSNNGNNN